MKKFLGFHPVLSRTGETAWRWIQFVLGSALFLSLRLDRNRHLFAFIVGYCKFAYPARRSAGSLARRRAWISRSGVELPCHLDHFGSEKHFSELFSLPSAPHFLRTDRLFGS